MRFVLLVSVVTLSACPSGPTLEDFCSKYVEAASARLSECNGAAADTWATALQEQDFCGEVLLSESQGHTKYHPEYAQACINIARTLPCELVAPGKLSNTEFDILCSETLSGQLPEGATCRANRECQLDYHCDQSATRCPGLCVRLRGFDEICDDASHPCASGFVCTPMGDKTGCGLAVGDGGACSDSMPCGSGLFCDPSTSPLVCMPGRTSGSCRDVTDCASGFVCTKDAGCAPALDAGAPCRAGRQECDVLSSCRDGVCQPGALLGQPCGELTANETTPCLQGSCVKTAGNTGTCGKYDAGALCDNSDQCGRGGFCSGTDQSTVAICHERCAPVVGGQ